MYVFYSICSKGEAYTLKLTPIVILHNLMMYSQKSKQLTAL